MTFAVLVLVGPTAIGKTALSLRIAERFDCEIISMDSMQVYRHMDIGTAKASSEEQALVRHHLIDIANPDEQYSAASFVTDAQAAITDIRSRGRIPLITGGTGLYLSSLNNGLFNTVEVKSEIRETLRRRLEQEGREALFRELQACDAESAARIHPNDTQRLLRGLELYRATGIPWSVHIRKQQETVAKLLPYPQLQLGLHCERALLRERIRQRTGKMMGPAFRKEVETLLALGYNKELPSMQSLGYRHMVRHVQGDWDMDTACQALITDTRRYAKRQFTWFGANKDIRWFDRMEADAIFRLVAQFLDEHRTQTGA